MNTSTSQITEAAAWEPAGGNSTPSGSSNTQCPVRLDPIAWPPTAQFLHLLWEKPATHIANDLGCCQASVLTRAKALGLPKPGHGYWQRVIAGVELAVPDNVQELMARLDADAHETSPIVMRRKARRTCHRSRILWPAKGELLHRLWTEPATHIAQDLGCAFSSILDRAKALGLPTPGVGYWQKKVAGIDVGIPANVAALMVTLDAESREGKQASEVTAQDEPKSGTGDLGAGDA